VGSGLDGELISQRKNLILVGIHGLVMVGRWKYVEIPETLAANHKPMIIPQPRLV
jgi:hypothetical protein